MATRNGHDKMSTVKSEEKWRRRITGKEGATKTIGSRKGDKEIRTKEWKRESGDKEMAPKKLTLKSAEKENANK